MVSASRQTSATPLLIVEDNAVLQRVLSDILRYEGFDVHTLASAEEAIDWLAQTPNPPHLILTDYLLIDMDGCALLNHVRNQPQLSHVPVVMLSADVELHSICGPDAPQPDGYVEKPFTTADLVATIRKALDDSRRN